jgi:hypothetical protein
MGELPDLDAIIEGRSGDVPRAIDLQYGVASAIVRRAVEARHTADAPRLYGNILRYARAFPEREMGVMLVTDLHRAIGQPLYGVPEFAQWAESISDLVLFDLPAARGW